MEVAPKFGVMYKLAVDYRVLTETFVSNVFDLDCRGHHDVFRTLYDRVVKEATSPIPTNRKWSSMTERVCALIVAAFQDSFEKSQVMTLGYLECLELLDDKNKHKASWTEIKRSIGFYFCLALKDQLEEFLKYQTASLVALSLSNQPDVVPDCVKQGHWRIGDFIPYCKRVTHTIRKECIQRRTPEAIKKAMSLYVTKRIAPAASDVFVTKALEKNKKALTEDHNIPDVIKLREEVIRTVRELYCYSQNPECSYDTPQTAADYRNKEIRNCKLNASAHHLKIPSLSACYENTRGKGGALGYLLKRAGFYAKTPHNQNNHEIIVCQRPFLGYATRPDRFVQPIPIYGILDEDQVRELLRPSLDGYGAGVFVRREPILEPFKVRIISKGEAVPYQRAQNYQPFLWSILQLVDCFSLTGRPLRENDLERVLAFGRDSRQHCQIVSGDYAAATDNLHVWLCQTAINEICHLWRIPFEDALNLSSCLTNHYIDCRSQESFRMNKKTGFIDDSETEGYDKSEAECLKQLWGQLMGSPVSFPILCIINAAVTRAAMERSFGKKITLKDGAFLVNGDDVIFTIPSGQYFVWVNYVTSAGLTPSIGKNYVSRRYGVINSQLYDCGLLWDRFENLKEGHVKFVPLVKMNLVRCVQHESTERRPNEQLVIGDALKHGKTLEGRFKELVKGTTGDLRDRLLKRAFYYAKPILALLPPISWTLPKCLGGLGLPSPSDHRVSELHLKIATIIACTDSRSRRDLIKLNWLREPGNEFCEFTNDYLNEVYDSLDIPIVLSTSKTDDPLYPKLIKSFLGFGVDNSVLDERRAVREWSKIYTRWVKKVQRVKWLKDDNGGLNIMNQVKAETFYEGVWTRSVPAVMLR